MRATFGTIGFGLVDDFEHSDRMAQITTIVHAPLVGFRGSNGYRPGEAVTMGRRMNRRTPPTRRRRKGLGFEMAAVDLAWDARSTHRDWLSEFDSEPESLAELLAAEYGIDPTDLDENELFESFLDAMEAETWGASGWRRIVN